MGAQSAPMSLLRSLGLVALDRLPPFKRRMALRGMGFRGDVAELALSR
jgi:2-octaprenyl-6-methoxyphenol hydroxylase